jgi:hypothetical protein
MLSSNLRDGKIVKLYKARKKERKCLSPLVYSTEQRAIVAVKQDAPRPNLFDSPNVRNAFFVRKMLQNGILRGDGQAGSFGSNDIKPTPSCTNRIRHRRLDRTDHVCLETTAHPKR